MKKLSLVFALLLVMAVPALAEEALPLVGRDTGLPLPRFASLKDDEVFVRAGPGQRYPIKFVYQRDGLPVQIVSEFGGWRKVKDARGGEGWVYNALVSGQRMALITSNAVMVRRSDKDSAPAVAELSEGVIARITTCEPSYCLVEGEGYKGWIERKSLWGVAFNESFEK